MTFCENKENESNISLIRQRYSMFANGTVIRIVFHNFLTYDNVVMKPGPYLNVVIGPNGTGKSSIICGICLAVGGSPKLLGRSDTYGDFIKHGKQEGSVEVYLWDAYRKRERVFTVRLKAETPNTAIFTVDGTQKKAGELRDIINKYNIQVDNPCTFLAQDKVKSFAEQGSQVLLKNTQKAGPSQLTEFYNELVELSAEGSGYGENIGTICRRLENIDMQLKTKKLLVDKYLEWEKRNEKIVKLRKTKAIFNYLRQLDRMRMAMIELDRAEKDSDDALARQEPIEKSLREVKSSCVTLEDDIEQLRKQKVKKITEITSLSNHSAVDDELQEAAHELAKIQNDYDNWDKEKTDVIKNSQKFKEMLHRARLEYNPDETLDGEKEELIRENERMKRETVSIKEQQTAFYRLKNIILDEKKNRQDLFESKMQKLVNLKRNNCISDAYEFYNNNKKKFRGPVYVPYLQVFVPAVDKLVYLNNVISTRDMGIFIFSCKEDEDLMLNGNENPYKIDTTIVGRDQIEDFNSSRSALTDELKELGFTSLLIDLLQAPDPVLAYLNAVFNLDKVLIGDHSVDVNYEQIARSGIGRKHPLILTPKHRIEVIYSRFDNEKYLLKRNHMNFRPRLDKEHTKHFTEIENRIESFSADEINLDKRITKFSEDKEILEDRIARYREHLKVDREKRGKIENLEEQVRRFDERLNGYSKDKPDLSAAKEAYEERKTIIARKALENFERVMALLEGQQESVAKLVLNHDEIDRLMRRRKLLTEQMEENKAQTNEYQDRYKKMLATRTELKADIEEAKSELKKYMSSQEWEEFSKTIKEFKKHNMFNDENEVDEMLVEEQNKLSRGRQEGTHNDLKDYEKLQSDRQALAKEMEKTEEKNKMWKNKMDLKLEKWIGPTRQLISEIGNNYSKFFAQLGCAGEVHLDEPENKYAMNDYGVKILVKFRNGNSLKELNPQTQSGGERSVATMLYLMALQNLCPVPFRCVDEINQGMDPENERAVFDLMVNLLNTEENVSKTQYFLLTPKLLSGLNFNERVTVHIVHNGPFIDNSEHWDPEKLLAD